MENNKMQHKGEGMVEEKQGNNFVTMNSPDDSLEFATGDYESLMVIDSPDDYEDEGE